MRNLVLLLGLALVLSGCSTYLTQSQNVIKEKKEYRKILVFARSQNRIARSLFERDVTEFLVEKGITATASLRSDIDIPIDRAVSEAESEAIRQTLYDLRETEEDNLQWIGRFVVEDPSKIEKATSKYATELCKALLESSIKAAN